MQLLKDFIGSFYSRALYHHVARDEAGIGMRFILASTVFSAVSLFAVLLAGYPQFRSALDQAPTYAANLPAVTVKAGKLSIDKPVPYKLQFGTAPDDIWVVVDTNYKITDVDALSAYLKKNRIMALVTDDKIITMKNQNGEVDIADLGKTDFSMSHEKWAQLADTAKHWGMCIAIVLGVIFFSLSMFVYHLIATFITAIAVKVLGAMMNADFDYMAGVRLAAAARVPVTVIMEILLLTPIMAKLPFLGWLVWLGYLIFAAWSSRPKTA